jgi:hypothetical protein
MISIPLFSTSRLTFRSPEPADYERPDGILYQLFNDESIQHSLQADPAVPRSREQTEKWFKECGDSAAMHCIFCLKDITKVDGDDKDKMGLEPVGWMTIDEIETSHRNATFGLAIAPKHQV